MCLVEKVKRGMKNSEKRLRARARRWAAGRRQLQQTIVNTRSSVICGWTPAMKITLSVYASGRTSGPQARTTGTNHAPVAAASITPASANHVRRGRSQKFRIP